MAKNDCSFHAQNSKLNPKRDVAEFLEKINYKCQSSNVLRKAKKITQLLIWIYLAQKQIMNAAKE